MVEIKEKILKPFEKLKISADCILYKVKRDEIEFIVFVDSNLISKELIQDIYEIEGDTDIFIRLQRAELNMSNPSTFIFIFEVKDSC